MDLIVNAMSMRQRVMDALNNFRQNCLVPRRELPISEIIRGARPTDKNVLSLLLRRRAFQWERESLVNRGIPLDVPFQAELDRSITQFIVQFPQEAVIEPVDSPGGLTLRFNPPWLVTFIVLPKANGQQIPIALQQDWTGILASAESMVYEFRGHAVGSEGLRLILQLNTPLVSARGANVSFTCGMREAKESDVGWWVYRDISEINVVEVREGVEYKFKYLIDGPYRTEAEAREKAQKYQEE